MTDRRTTTRKAKERRGAKAELPVKAATQTVQRGQTRAAISKALCVPHRFAYHVMTPLRGAPSLDAFLAEYPLIKRRQVERFELPSLRVVLWMCTSPAVHHSISTFTS